MVQFDGRSEGYFTKETSRPQSTSNTTWRKGKKKEVYSRFSLTGSTATVTKVRRKTTRGTTYQMGNLKSKNREQTLGSLLIREEDPVTEKTSRPRLKEKGIHDDGGLISVTRGERKIGGNDTMMKLCY